MNFLSFYKRVNHKTFSIECFLLPLFLIANFLLKYWHWNEPIETDLLMYCMGGHTFHINKLLYVNLWDQKPPLIHFLYAVAESFFGYGKGEVRAVNIFFSSALIIELWWIAKRCHSNIVSLTLLMLFLVIGIFPNIEYEVNQPNCELIVNVFLAFGFISLIANYKNIKKYSLFGLSVLAASMVKHHSVIPMTSLAIASIIIYPSNKVSSRLGFLVACFSSLVIGWAILFIFYINIHHFSDIWLCLVSSNASYNPNYIDTILKAFYWKNLAFLIISLFGPAMIIYSQRSGALRNISLFAISLSIGCYTMLAIPGMWWPHYYQLMILPIYISVVLILVCFYKTKSRTGLILITLFITTICSYNIFNYISLSDLQISEKKYKGPWFKDTELVAPIIKSLLTENEWFFVWGQDPGLYVYTNIWPHTRFNTYFPFVFSKVQPKVYPIFFSDVCNDPPDLIIFPAPQVSMIGPNIADPILDWIASNYFPVIGGEMARNYLICCRTGSKLSQRLPASVSKQPLKSIIRPLGQ